ncbi:MAG: glycoside hydrolase family 18 protein [Chloroflexota bacterium]
MLSSERRRSPRTSRRSGRIWLFALLVPFIVAACVTVVDPGSVAQSPVASQAASTPDPFATPSLAPLASPTPRPTPAPTPEPIDAEVFGFLPNWLIEDAALAMDTDLLTTVAIHGVEASRDGRLVARKPSGEVPSGWKVLQSDAFRQLQAKLQNDGVKVVLTVQRFGWSEGTLKRTTSLLNDKQARARLAQRIAKLVDERGLDGVNLDFEPMPSALTNRFSAFVREVRTELDKVDDDLQLSVDVVSSISGYDLAALTAAAAADFAIIMGYNYRGERAARAGSMAPLIDPDIGDLNASVEMALAEVSPDKIVLALPWYGRAWSTESDQEGAATVSGRGIDGSANVPYAVAVEFATKSGRRFEPDQVSAWTAYPSRKCATCDSVWRQVWYDDPDSFGTKIDYALEQELAGVGVWALGHEAGREEMWWALRDRLRPRQDDAPPNGSASLDPVGILGELEGLEVVEGSAPLRLFASDGSEGSGLVLARIGLGDELDGAGRLVDARTYPAADRIDFPLADPETGGSGESGPRSIQVQWRDIAGNWSTPLTLEVWVQEPTGMPTPGDLG